MQHEVIVFGATSFVGQILCHHLAERFSRDEINWAMAGRSESKLQTLKNELPDAFQDVPVIVADAKDEAAIREMVAQTAVVISTVGPYALYGETLVRVCAETGTDYVDLTGEVQWIGRMIRGYEDQAKANGARIVHCCGFDSLPSDLGVNFLQRQAKEQFGEVCSRVKMRVRAMRGGFSGGTAASLMNVAKEAASDSALRKELANPYSICPPDHGVKTRQPNVTFAQHDGDFGAWVAPFVMAAVNTRIVHRSNALSDYSYGREFRYDEAVLTGKGIVGGVTAATMAGAIGSFLVGAAIPPTRWVLEKFLPGAGEGPSPEAQEKRVL